MSRHRNRRHTKQSEPGIWIRYTEAEETREHLSEALEGCSKIVNPIKAWRLYGARRAASEPNRKAFSRRFLEKRLGYPALG